MKPEAHSSASSILYESFLLFFFSTCFWAYFIILQSLARIFMILQSLEDSQCCTTLFLLSPKTLLPWLWQPTLCPREGSASWEECTEARTFFTSVHYSFLQCSAYFTFGKLFSFYCFFSPSFICPELLLFCRVCYSMIPVWFLQHISSAARLHWAISVHLFLSFILCIPFRVFPALFFIICSSVKFFVLSLWFSVYPSLSIFLFLYLTMLFFSCTESSFMGGLYS